jgi:hypothetical protein
MLSNSSGKQSMMVYLNDKSSAADRGVNVGKMVHLKCNATDAGHKALFLIRQALPCRLSINYNLKGLFYGRYFS